MPPDLDTHLDYVVSVRDEDALRRAIDVLLSVETCFAVIGGELRLRLTKRGVDALSEHLL